ncbi:hypothetical protein BS50DRAFT_594982 [Corynespora cassiicola Philippines]|uniref:Uncharacterized protein n=1 Tax=Corynespora cassiicola Philippines TaxID=1448308 RepID=A0A2T2N0S7_CORCC|nr:hypothetical protein BS50DRAFT_594982 [Corynespora cassiicola Philippines]
MATFQPNSSREGLSTHLKFISAIAPTRPAVDPPNEDVEYIPKQDLGYAISTACRYGRMEFVRAVFDMKEEPHDILHFDEDDLCDEFLRNFKCITASSYIQASTQESGAARRRENFGENFFLGYVNDDASVSLILAPMVLNKKGCWIGENIAFITRQDVVQLSEELPRNIVEQIEQYRKEKSEEEDIWRRALELCEWEEDLQRREDALNQMNEAI